MNERKKIIAQKLGMSLKEIDDALGCKKLNTCALDKMIENVIGIWHLPYAVCPNFLINNKDYLVPMVGYEPSVVAAASKAAKIIREHGGFKAKADPPIMIAQVILYDVAKPNKAKKIVSENKNQIIKQGNRALPNLIKRGGGIKNITVVDYPAGTGYLAIELEIDVCDAMGANIVNTIAEYASPTIADLTKEKILMCILTNYAVKRKATSEFSIPVCQLSTKKISSEEFAKRIVSASRFAGLDAKRACTQNKGGFNGMDAVAMALGIDCQALEAAGHCYATSSGYGPLCKFQVRDDILFGKIELPIAAGIVGGISQTHPGVKFSLKLLRVESAKELAMVIASAGLASTTAALGALVTEGIQRSHMKLHFRKKL
ncbi:hydroxymethylglutaryl-CoA reductase, degradative [Candidatus Parcubacteria bacterium]|nr:hydroxymethylglutaryl-CoA reductase, degradative [Candidatus Parcubacteria bacterium]